MDMVKEKEIWLVKGYWDIDAKGADFNSWLIKSRIFWFSKSSSSLWFFISIIVVWQLPP